MGTFTADDGERLHLHISGSGSPLILLHGWTSSHAVWTPLLKGLTQAHRIFRPDARGHGGHGLTATQTPDVARLARDILNLLDHYGLERAAVVGHSMGALTLWQFIRDHGSERLSRLCIIDQSPKLLTDPDWPHGIYGDFDATRSARLIEELEEDFAEAVLRLIAHGLNTKARQGYERDGTGWQQSRRNLRRLDPVPLIAIWKSLVAADYRDVLPKIAVPTLLSWGAESNFYPLATARYLLSHIPRASLSRFDGADHCPQLHQPERFAAELLDFLA
ncbi:MAG: alpha/beta hydrolase [Rhodocyclaceae bacterium]|nr:alpha/beta hydrolase [Rhodocyclaceae bacterium]